MRESLWKATASLPRFDPLHGDTATDVLIIGGGMAGLLTAYFLQQNGVEYLLVEKGRIGGGITGNTTAKLTAQHGLIYHKIEKQYGTERAAAYLDANLQALKRYAALAKEINCDYESETNAVYSKTDRQRLENELSTLQRLKYPAAIQEQPPLPFDTKGAVAFPHQAQFHPLKFLNRVACGLNVCENTFVREMEGTTAVTDQGKIRAKRVIVTTHFPFINKHGSYFLKLYQHRSYVLALENAPEWQGMYVDDEKTGLSFRRYKQLLLLGGGGHRTGQDGGNYNELRAFAATHYPESREVFAWAAQDCMSLDGLPYIGQYAKTTPRLYTATGFNKWGMTGAMVAAQLLANRMAGKPDPYAKVFDPSRSMLKPQLVVNGTESIKNLLSPAVKRCPHLGCALQWNAAEHSWDCPCHGSRFDEDGKLLDNPANSDMKD